MENQTLMQAFEWYLPSDGLHWQKLAQAAPDLAAKGIRKIWLPPAFKATNADDVGYGVYDLFDLGEFDQKGTIRTKYGTKDDYLAAINSLKANGIDPIADVVLNHKAAADHKERFTVIEMDPNNRQQAISEPFEIEGWTHFSFDGRQKQYNDFEWHWYHFTGTDFDASTGKNGIYQIQGDNKGWANDDLVDDENGNYDYLMYADIDFKHPEVVQNLYDWAHWFIDTTGIQGFRLDAVKHIDSSFMQQFIHDLTAEYGEAFYVFGEFWNGDEATNEDYLTDIQFGYDLVDVKLHQNFFDAGQQGENYDLRQLFAGSLMENHPQSAVTFVDNHDTQRGQALESTVAEWFKPLAYASILLREAGLPCLFYGDYYGIQGDFAQMSFQTILDPLLELRLQLAYGEQTDYLDDPHCIAWVRHGNEQTDFQPLAVLLNNSVATTKRIFVGEQWAGQAFSDYLGLWQEPVIVESDGWAEFPVGERSLGAWSVK